MVKIKAKKRLIKASEANSNNNNTPKIVKKLKKKALKNTPKPPLPVPVPAAAADSSSDADSSSSDDDTSLSEPDMEDIKTLLEPYTKDQLIDLLAAAAVNDQTLYTRICDSADHDPVHRKIFVHGLGWDTTRETLTAAFDSYGEIEECKVVTDRVTGKAKGFGFVLFKSRHGAMKALKEPRKKISNRIASCQLASLGPAAPSSSTDTLTRKIYVSNVHADVDSERLRSFFAKFGEIEMGPMGFDTATGKSRGFALFLYKTPEGARKALEEPHKFFEGHQLVCQMAADGKNKGNLLNTSVMVVPPVPSQTPPLLSAVAAQNLAMFNQQPTLNPMYGGLFTNPNAGFLAPGQMSSLLTSQGLLGSSQMGSLGGAVGNVGIGYGGARAQGLGSLGGNQSLLGGQGLGSLGGNQSLLGAQGLGGLGGNQSLLGTFGTPSRSMPSSLGLQHAYPSSQIGQSSTARPPQGSIGSFGGFSTRMWYALFRGYLLFCSCFFNCLAYSKCLSLCYDFHLLLIILMFMLLNLMHLLAKRYCFNRKGTCILAFPHVNLVFRV